MAEKSPIAKREEEILQFWQDKRIFQKSLEKDSPKGEFIFYDGPPFATGLPHYGHMLPGTVKDVIPRFKTMQGYHVPRRWGWDCHGLPVENLVEKELGLASKKDIDEYGVEKFNDVARASVLRFDADWKKIIPRSGRFVDMDHAYLTMDWTYSESIWWSFKTLHDKSLIYQGFKVMPYCPHDGTTLSNFEVAQGYKDITDISAYVKFELVDSSSASGQVKTFVVAWTTTPWTLPGNVALAVNPEIVYVEVDVKDIKIIVAKERLVAIKDEYKVLKEFSGKELVGKKYKPVFEYYKDAELKNKENIWKIVGADFVTTTDGTGVVHIAPAFGEDDYNLSLKENLPFIQHVGTDGAFKKEVTDFAGLPVKPKEDPQKGDIEIIKYLAHHDTLFAKEKIVHSYPHCWRCLTPLLNYATSSWFVKVTDFKDKLVSENKKVNWLPKEIGDGRFGKWLEGARDWAISRSRYWGAPLPVWICKDCGKVEVVASVSDIKKHTKKNKYILMRHGEAQSNVLNTVSFDLKAKNDLTKKGREQTEKAAKELSKKNIDIIVSSDILRAKETAEIIAKGIDIPAPEIIFDPRLREFNFGDYDGKSMEKWIEYRTSLDGKDHSTKVPHGESSDDVRKRIAEFLYDIDSQYQDKNILIISHQSPLWYMQLVAEGVDADRPLQKDGFAYGFKNSEYGEFDFAAIPHNRNYDIDLHRPFIDEVTWSCDCGGTFKRVPEVFDTWYESGSMPYAQIHYPFENKELIDKGTFFPADFIAEGQDQTRGWFYSLLVLSTALFGESPYKSVIVNGIILAEDGQKMSKSLKNYPDINTVFDKYGADALRYFLMSSPAVKAEDVAFSEKSIDEVVKKITMRLQNVYTFYATYAAEKTTFDLKKTSNILDFWIMARLQETGLEMTHSLEAYELDRASRPIMSFVDDLSTWYLRRSRDRFKGDDEKDKQSALATTQYVFLELSKLLAPFMPFLAEDLYQKVNTEKKLESVHLEVWPDFGKKMSSGNVKLLEEMNLTRATVSLALEARAKANIKVRQPLQKITINHKLQEEYVALVQDEVNIKEVITDKKQTEPVILDTTISPELKEEGLARELIRALQDFRKEQNLNQADTISLSIDTTDTAKKFIEKFEKEIMKTTKIIKIVFEKNDGKEIVVEDLVLKVAIV